MFIASDRASLVVRWGGGGGGIFGGGSRGIVSMIVVFVLGGALHGGGLISVFYGFFASIGGIFLLAGELGAEFPKILSLTSFGNSYIPCL